VERVSWINGRMQQLKFGLMFLVLNSTDAILTKALIADGGFELNPMARYALLTKGSWLFWLGKVGLGLFLVALFLRYALEFPQFTRNVLKGITIAMAIVCAWNATGLFI